MKYRIFNYKSLSYAVIKELDNYPEYTVLLLTNGDCKDCHFYKESSDPYLSGRCSIEGTVEICGKGCLKFITRMFVYYEHYNSENSVKEDFEDLIISTIKSIENNTDSNIKDKINSIIKSEYCSDICPYNDNCSRIDNCVKNRLVDKLIKVINDER